MRRILKLFKSGAVTVTGQRGSGKDMLTANVIARRRQPYISNLDYHSPKSEYIPLDIAALDCGKNTYDNLISGDVIPYRYPYPDGADIYITDVGIYMPAQYCNELNKKYPYLPTFFALSRHLGNANVHFNTQNLNRCWDKLREQSDTYIRCKWTKVLFGKLVIQRVIVYDRSEACQARLEPCRIKVPLLCTPERREQIQMYLDNFYNTHGSVKQYTLIYFNQSNYDTRFFRRLFSSEEAPPPTTEE